MNQSVDPRDPNDETRAAGSRTGMPRLVWLVGAAALAALSWWVAGVTRDVERGGEATAAMAGMEGMAGMDASADGSLQLSASDIREFGVTFGTADMRTLEDLVRTTGVVDFDETRLTQVTLKIGGYIERLHVDFTGQSVRREQPLLDIYSPELVSAQQELLIARQLERTIDASAVPGVPTGSSDLVAAATRRLRRWDISEAQIQRVLSTGEVQRSLTLHAPTSGVVIEKHVLEGQAVQPGQALYTVADLAEVWVLAELRENEAGRVREGTSAMLEFAAFPGRPFRGRVSYLAPTLQDASRTVKARVVMANPDGRIKPGMYATVRFSTPDRSTLTVPASAVVRTGERSMVFVDMGGGRFMPQEIETGRAGDAYVEVLAGLEPGQRVVTSAQFLLDSESNLAEVMRSMMGMGGGAGDMKGMDMRQSAPAAPAPRR